MFKSKKNKKIQICIDGPAGSGKSVLGIFLAQKFNLLYIDSGIIYRAFVFFCLQNKINFNDLKKIKKNIKIFNVSFQSKKIIVINNNEAINIKNFYKSIINENLNFVTNNAFLRKKVVKILRAMSKNNDVVMVGRDIGSVVLKKAKIKIFLDASLKQRIQRRFKQKTLTNLNLDFKKVKENLIKRDNFDINRKNGALKHVKNEIYFDNSSLNVWQTNQKIVTLLLKKYKFLKIYND